MNCTHPGLTRKKLSLPCYKERTLLISFFLILTAYLNIVDQCFIQVKHQSVYVLITIIWLEEGWMDFWQVCEVVRENASGRVGDCWCFQNCKWIFTSHWRTTSTSFGSRFIGLKTSWALGTCAVYLTRHSLNWLGTSLWWAIFLSCFYLTGGWRLWSATCFSKRVTWARGRCRFSSAALPLASFCYSADWLNVDVGKDERILTELLNVVQNITDKIDRYLIELLEPALNDLEDVFPWVGLANVHNDIFCICGVHPKHLSRLILVCDFFY